MKMARPINHAITTGSGRAGGAAAGGARRRRVAVMMISAILTQHIQSVRAHRPASWPRSSARSPRHGRLRGRLRRRGTLRDRSLSLCCCCVLKEKAFEWLQHLEIHPPNGSRWYPNLAVEMAHKAFRLEGELATFRRYLSHPSRKQTLKTLKLL